MISSSIIVISGIVIVLAVTIFFGFIFNTMYNNLTIEHWLPQTIIVGIIITSLATCAGIIDNNNSKVKKSIENTIAFHTSIKVFPYIRKGMASNYLTDDDNRYQPNQ